MEQKTYYKLVRIILLILLIATAWSTIHEYLSWVHGLVGTIVDALFLVMTDIKIKEYENNL